MLKIKIKDKEYKLRFGYGVLAKTDLLERVQTIGNTVKEDNAMQKMLRTLAELFLAGAQKYHKEEFPYDTEEEKEPQIDKIYDLLDDYEDESTEEEPQSGFILFNLMQEELMANGFLSGAASVGAEEVARKQDVTVIPMDHKKTAKK